MIEKATVIRTEGDRVILACRSQGCKTCSSMFCKPGNRQEFEAVNPKGLDIHRSDEVEFYVQPGRAILAGFIVLVMPLIAFALAYFGAGLLAPEPSEQVRVLSGLGGLLLGFGAAYMAGKRDNRYPVVVGAPDHAPVETSSPTT